MKYKFMKTLKTFEVPGQKQADLNFDRRKSTVTLLTESSPYCMLLFDKSNKQSTKLETAIM
jgi:hypothetical protein